MRYLAVFTCGVVIATRWMLAIYIVHITALLEKIAGKQ